MSTPTLDKGVCEQPVGRRNDRIAFIDGLRGLAVLMVAISHAWMQHPPHPFQIVWHHNKMQLTQPGTVLDMIAGRGYQGVSLFLVLSGFCLSYPILTRRASGVERWFVASQFFARRCLRILPPYYAALALSAASVRLFARQHWPPLPAMGTTTLSVPDLLAHIMLVHNLILSFEYSINSPFWSLALEWQWYWIFPLILVCCIRWPVGTVGVCLVVAMAWQAEMRDISFLMSWLPARLFEFCCAVLVTRVVRDGRLPHPAVLASGIVLVLAIAEAPIGSVVGDTGLYQPLYGVAFALLLLLAHRSRRVGAILSWRTLAGLGLASYSVYLIHRPVIDSVEAFSPIWLRSSPVIVPLALGVGLGLGAAFHILVERPCMNPTIWGRASRLLVPALRWTDRLYAGQKATTGPRPQPVLPG